MHLLESQAPAESISPARKLTILNCIVNNLLDAVVVVNAERRIEFANSTSARLMKRSVDEILNMTVYDVFPDKEDGNADIHSAIEQIFATSGSSLGGGGRATIQTAEGAKLSVVLIVGAIRGEDGTLTGVSLSFRSGSPAAISTTPSTSTAPGTSPAAVSSSTTVSGVTTSPAATKPGASASAASGSTSSSSEGGKAAALNPVRQKAIRAIETRIDGEVHSFAVILALSQFDVFRLRYGQANAEKLVRVFCAHILESLGPSDRLYEWSSRTLVLLVERDSTLDEVRLEMTAMCSRRLDYFLDASERSALVTLSAAWTLLPLEDTDTAKVVAQIDSFDRAHTRKR